jgi:cobalamin biosynthesis protein CobT
MKINSRVLIMREAVGKLVNMLAQKEVKVTQRGSKAFVEYNPRTLEPKRVNIPYMPDDASEELMDAIQGFLDHEVAHILFTNSRVIPKAKAAKVGRMHNIIEDSFIEKKMADHFSGSGLNLRNVGHYFLKSYTDKKIKENPKKVAGVLIVPAVRAWAGQQVYIDYMKDKWHMIPGIVDALGPDIGDIVSAVKSTEDSLTVALLIKKRLDDAKEAKDKAAAMCEGMAGDPTPTEEGEPSEEAAEDGEESTPSPTGKPGKKPGDSEESEESDGDQEGDDIDLGDGPDDSLPPDPSDSGDDDQPAAGDEESATNAEDEGENGEEGSSKSDDKPKSGEKDDQPKGAEDSEGEGAKAEAGAKGDKGDEGDKGEDKPADGSSDKADGSKGKKDSKEGGNPGEKTKPLGAPEKEPGPTGSEELEAEMGADYDDAIAEEISKQSRKEAADSDYTVYTKDFDRIEPMTTVKVTSEVLERLQNNVDHLVGAMQKGLERAIAAKSAATWTGGHRKGRLHAGSLTRLNFGDDRVFRRKHVNFTKDVAVELVVDLSGSMSQHNKMETAAYAAYGLSSVLERMGIQHEVIGFTTLPIDIEDDASHAETAGVRYARNEALYMPIIKGWGERVTADVKTRFAKLTCDVPFMRENVDGECVQIASMRLYQRKETRKIMIVLSDGQPACGGESAVLDAHLKASVKEITKMGIDVVGIGINSEYVRKFYPKCVVIKEVSELPAVVMSELRQMLTK